MKTKVFIFYSFAIDKDEILKEIKPLKKTLCCRQWVTGVGGKSLVGHKISFEPINPDLHIWNIIKGKKIVIFTTPVADSCSRIHSFVSFIENRQRTNSFVHCLWDGIMTWCFSLQSWHKLNEVFYLSENKKR